MKKTMMMMIVLSFIVSACGTIDDQIKIDCIEMNDNTKCEVIKVRKECQMKGCLNQ